jgi:DNA-repair protein complementing XP-A cells
VEEGDEDEKDVELEDFEVGASPFVSKKEAMQTYCLPEGTLAVCSFVEKENPRNKKWAPLKLYNRAEIRRRARERFGGLEGLVKERQRRVEKRFRKDMETAKNVFK